MISDACADKARDRTTGDIVALKKILLHQRENGQRPPEMLLSPLPNVSLSLLKSQVIHDWKQSMS